MNGMVINGSEMLQRYGFILYKRHALELHEIKISHGSLGFYDDWRPYHYAPYSGELSRDMEKCRDDTIRISDVSICGRKTRVCRATARGRERYRYMLERIPEMAVLEDRVRRLQQVPRNVLTRQIYNAYPGFSSPA